MCVCVCVCVVYICGACVRVREGVRARARVRACACVRACVRVYEMSVEQMLKETGREYEEPINLQMSIICLLFRCVAVFGCMQYVYCNRQCQQCAWTVYGR